MKVKGTNTEFYFMCFVSYLISDNSDSIFPFECSVLNNGTTSTIIITSLV